jgi:O-antigen/teichoic acid export membrane protein
MLGFSAQITAYDMLNALIVRLDVILLGCFIGRIPAVTLSSVGIYGAVVEVAGGLRKINQVVYGPIFAPVIAGMTVHGEQERAAAAFSRVSQWMLWLLLPAVAVLILAGPLILSIYGPAFPAGANWLIIVAIACGTNAFVGLAETVIMVQRPRINLFNSFVTAVVAIIADIWLISRFGVTGAAFGILLPYVLQGFLRQRALRSVFGWPNPWREALPPIIAAILGAVPAFVCRVSIHGISGQVAGSLVFLAIFGGVWLYYRRVAPPIPVS